MVKNFGSSIGYKNLSNLPMMYLRIRKKRAKCLFTLAIRNPQQKVTKQTKCTTGLDLHQGKPLNSHGFNFMNILSFSVLVFAGQMVFDW